MLMDIHTLARDVAEHSGNGPLTRFSVQSTETDPDSPQEFSGIQSWPRACIDFFLFQWFRFAALTRVGCYFQVDRNRSFSFLFLLIHRQDPALFCSVLLCCQLCLSGCVSGG